VVLSRACLAPALSVARDSAYVQSEYKCTIGDGDVKLGMEVGVLTEMGCKSDVTGARSSQGPRSQVLGARRKARPSALHRLGSGIQLGDRILFAGGVPINPETGTAIEQILNGPYPLPTGDGGAPRHEVMKGNDSDESTALRLARARAVRVHRAVRGRYRTRALQESSCG
jgi:hypothetical protein